MKKREFLAHLVSVAVIVWSGDWVEVWVLVRGFQGHVEVSGTMLCPLRDAFVSLTQMT